MSIRPLALVLVVVCTSVRADDIDTLVQALGVGSAENMAIGGVFGKTTDQLKDPRSMQIMEAYSKRGSNDLVGCMRFRSKNGFGGYVEGSSVWHLKSAKGKPVLQFNVNNVATWNSSCAGKGFKDGRALANLLLDKMRDKL